MPFSLMSACLTQPHLTTGDIKAIQMSYFDYLIYLATEKGKSIFLSQLYQLLAMCLRLKPKGEINGQPVYDIDFICRENEKSSLRIGDLFFNGEDFDSIREIISEQNALELPDETTNPDIVKAYKTVEEYNARHSNVKICDLEDQINIVVAKTAYKRNEVLGMTIRSFVHLTDRIDRIMRYELLTLLSPNMEEKDRKSIEHYMEARKTQKEKYKTAFVTQESVEKKINGRP